jgi:lycopene beta-cyclase
MSQRYQYLALLGLCLLAFIPLEFLGPARVVRRPKEAFLALIGPFALMSFVNEIAVNRELWRYSPRYTSGVRLPRHYPIEEVVSFIVFPLCCLLIFETLSARVPSSGGEPVPFIDPTQRSGPVARFLFAVVGAATGLILLIELWIERNRLSSVTSTGDRLLRSIDWDVPEFPVITVGLLAGLAFIETGRWHTGVFRKRTYWLAILMSLVAVGLVNAWLTKASAPIVIFSRDELTGFRPIANIPIEVFVFQFVLLTLVMMSWLRATTEHFGSET